MTLRELAAEAGVSVATVSKAFKDSDEISRATKEKIFALARERGCFHKYYKERYEKKVVAIICPEIKSAHYSEQVEYIQSRLARSNTEVMISTDDFSTEKQATLIAFYAAHNRADGIIVFDLREAVPKGIEIPVIALDADENVPHSDVVRTDSFHAFCEAAAHLKQLGHRQIAFIGERLTHKQFRHFREALRRYDLSPAAMITADGRFEEAGQNGIGQLLQNGTPFTAVICGYDYIAIGAIKALKQHRLRVPEDISVIGCNNIPTAGHLEKGLTTIDQTNDAACKMACDLLQKKMQNKYYCAGTAITLTGSLILRETTGPAKPVQKNADRRKA